MTNLRKILAIIEAYLFSVAENRVRKPLKKKGKAFGMSNKYCRKNFAEPWPNYTNGV
jgi:hypothetical protein